MFLSGFHNWAFPKLGVPQNGWYIMETPIKIDDLGVPLFLETHNCFWFFALLKTLHHHRSCRR